MKKILTFLAIVIAFTACKKDENKGPFPGTKVGDHVNGGYIITRDDKGHGIMMTDTNLNPSTGYTYAQSITVCKGLRNGGYSDWRLPTGKELDQMGREAFLKKIGSFPEAKGFDLYWGSEYTTDSIYGGYFNKDSILILKMAKPEIKAHLRPVRSY